VGRKVDGLVGRLPMSPAAAARAKMADKLTSETGKAIYARRKAIVEHVYGQIKRTMGFCRFSLRGLSKVSHEWGIVCRCHNLLKLWRSRRHLVAA
jgi:hypothetical protein